MTRGQRLLLGVGVVLAATVYWMRLDAAAGLFKDDGWYIVLGKALAGGRGMTLINFPVEGAVYHYPPVFPAMLAGVFALFPDFPENLRLLKAISGVAMGVAGWLTYRLVSPWEIPRSVAVLIGFGVALAPSWVFLATSSVMAECVFLALMLATLVLADRQQRGAKWVVLLALLASLTYLTRSAGVALIIAVALWMAKERRWRDVTVFAVATAMFGTPWLLYKSKVLAQAPSELQAKLPGGYREQFWQRAAGADRPAEISARELPLRVWQNTAAVVGADAGALLLPVVFRPESESGEEVVELTTAVFVPRDFIGWGPGSMGNSWGTKLISLLASLAMVAGFVTVARKKMRLAEILTLVFLGTIIVWPGPTFRYLLPLTPLLLYYFTIGVKELLSSLEYEPDCWTFGRGALLCVLALYAYDHYGYIQAKRLPVTEAGHPAWRRKFDAAKGGAEWIKANTSPLEVVAGDNVPLTYLYAGRMTEKCSPAVCAQQGVRYYLRLQEGFDFAPEHVRYQSPQDSRVQVAELPRR